MFNLRVTGRTLKPLMCINASSSTVDRGCADGLQSRTLRFSIHPGWRTASFAKVASSGVRDVGDTIKRSSFTPPSTSAARFTQVQSIRQEVVRDELEADLLKHSQRGVWRNTQLVDVKIDDGDQEYPVVARAESIARRPRSRPNS